MRRQDLDTSGSPPSQQKTIAKGAEEKFLS